MFISVERLYTYSFKIIDSDFIEEVDSYDCLYPMTNAIIKCYSFRKLDVAYNLFLHYWSYFYKSEQKISEVTMDSLNRGLISPKCAQDILEYIKRYSQMRAFL